MDGEVELWCNDRKTSANLAGSSELGWPFSDGPRGQPSRLHVEQSVDVGCSLPVGAVRSGLSGSSTASRCEDQLLLLEGNLGSKTQEE